MSCDAHWKLGEHGEFELDRSRIDWRVRPARCRHESDGTTAGQINLVGLRWRGWGTRRARARGFITANHYAEDGSLPRYPVTVILSGLRKACPKAAAKRRYYTRMRLVHADGSRSEPIPMFLPRRRCADSLKRAPAPVARCRLSWYSDHAHWSASGTFRGAVRIGPPFREFTWRFKVTERCVGDACEYPGRDPDSLIRHHRWTGKGINTPA